MNKTIDDITILIQGKKRVVDKYISFGHDERCMAVIDGNLYRRDKGKNYSLLKRKYVRMGE